MQADLTRLVKLQALDAELQQLRRVIETEQERQRAIESAVDTKRLEVTAAKEQLVENQRVRRELEKELAQVQTRLSRYRDQLMAVKTNKEYHAMQAEIATAEAEVRRHEDGMLEKMVEADDFASQIRTAEQAVAQAEREATAAIRALSAETSAARARLDSCSAERAKLAGEVPRATLDLFESISSRRGTAVAEARDGHCSVCHVRLRPKVFQDIRRNDSILQCDSCQRILYTLPPAVAPAAGQ